MEVQKKQSAFEALFATIVIPATIVIAVLVYMYIFGAGSNFEGGTNEGHPLPGNYFAIIYKGGVIVPILMSFLMMVFVFSIERFFTLMKANGSGRLDTFVHTIKSELSKNNVDGAIAVCDKQKGSIGNVIRSVLVKYKQMLTERELNKEQKLSAIHQELEESTALELPMLNKNLNILSTLASVGTLVALLGTVLGMIKAFAAMSSAGTPDAAALATGISEALINTAIGIGTSALAIICYNYFTSQIDDLTYRIDEAGMDIAQTFNTYNK